MIKTPLTRQDIVALLDRNNTAVGRALVHIKNRQNVEEQILKSTRYLNGRGFRPCHARLGTDMAKFYERNKYLSPKQLAYWRGRDRAGNSRIGIYWKQLVEEAKKKTNG